MNDLKPCREQFREDFPQGTIGERIAYEVGWNRRSGEADVKAVLESLRDKSVFSDEDKVQKLVETLRWYDEEILILKQARDDAESEHHRLRSRVEKVRDEYQKQLDDIKDIPEYPHVRATRGTLSSIIQALTRILEE